MKIEIICFPPRNVRHWFVFALLLAAQAAVLPAAEDLILADKLKTREWPASWIAAAEGPEKDAGVFHFRRTLELNEAPEHFIVHVSADNRYLLHVNGRRVGIGPLRGDLRHWSFETYDLAPFLEAGKNLIAATVWNFGTMSPQAQMSRRTGFLLQGDDEASAIINTGAGWEGAWDQGHAPNPESIADFRARGTYFVASPGERRDGAIYDWRWDQSDSTSGKWHPAREIGHGYPRTISAGPGWMMSPEGWMLTPSPLPSLEYRPISAGAVVRSSGGQAEGDFPQQGKYLVPPKTHAKILLDRRELTNAYPELIFSGGRQAVIRLTYAEALIGPKRQKGNRNEIEGKEISGFYDEVVADGAENRSFTPLWFRTWRFLQIDVETQEEPLQLLGLKANFTGFPLEEKARFSGEEDPTLAKIWEVAWRTVRLGALETYVDAPYWEQLQYIGDTRITALTTYAVANDDRLARRAIEDFDWSRISEGITMSRYPTAEPQFTPSYSLFWVSMLHDFWMYRDDPAFVKEHLPGTRTVLAWFRAHLRSDGLLGHMPYWIHEDTGSFLDSAIQDEEGRSGIVTAQLAGTLREAAEMEEAMGDPHQAADYRQQADVLAAAVAQLWDPEHGLMADTPARKSWGHPMNIMSLYFHLVPPDKTATVAQNVLSIGRHPAGRSVSGTRGAAWPLDEIPAASLFFRFYLARALETTGLGNSYIELLTPWRQELKVGLSTFPEHATSNRSDSHAWSAHPPFDLLRLVAGIKPAAPGFKRVLIEPHLGPLKKVDALMPTPHGDVQVSYRLSESNVLHAEITLPAELTGEFVFRGHKTSLHQGAQVIEAQ